MGDAKVKLHDLIIVNDANMKLHNEQMVIVDVNPEARFKEFKGEDAIRAEDRFGTTYTLSPVQFELDESGNQTPVKPTEYIVPKVRDKGTQQPFYIAVEATEHGVSYFDDNSHRRSVGWDKVKKIDKDDVWEVLYDLSTQVNLLKQAYKEAMNVLSVDFKLVNDKAKEL